MNRRRLQTKKNPLTEKRKEAKRQLNQILRGYSKNLIRDFISDAQFKQLFEISMWREHGRKLTTNQIKIIATINNHVEREKMSKKLLDSGNNQIDSTSIDLRLIPSGARPHDKALVKADKPKQVNDIAYKGTKQTL